MWRKTGLLNIHSVVLSHGVPWRGKGATCKMRFGSELRGNMASFEANSQKNVKQKCSLRKIKISRLCVSETSAKWNHHQNVAGQGLVLWAQREVGSLDDGLGPPWTMIKLQVLRCHSTCGQSHHWGTRCSNCDVHSNRTSLEQAFVFPFARGVCSFVFTFFTWFRLQCH